MALVGSPCRPSHARGGHGLCASITTARSPRSARLRQNCVTQLFVSSFFILFTRLQAARRSAWCAPPASIAYKSLLSRGVRAALTAPVMGQTAAMKGTIFETEFLISTRASPDARRAPKEGSSAPNFRENVGVFSDFQRFVSTILVNPIPSRGRTTKMGFL